MAEQLPIYESGEEEMHHECFISAVIDPTGNALRHIVPLSYDQRGRANIGAGISFLTSLNEPIQTEKAAVTPREFLEHFNSDRNAVAAIGHGRYRTDRVDISEGNINHVHPFHIVTKKGFEMSYAMNGNTTNGAKLQKELTGMGLRIPVDDFTDSRTNAVYLAHASGTTEMEKFRNGFQKIQGSHSDVILTRNGIYGVRDPMGNRPEVLGTNGQGAFAIASESAALETIGFEMIKNIEPGTILHIDWNGEISEERYAESNMQAFCVDEINYFANRHSQSLDERKNLEVRYQLGYRLGEIEDVIHKGENYVVAGIPKTGTDAGHGYAAAMNFPYMKLYDIVDPEIRSYLVESEGKKKAAQQKLRINETVFEQVVSMGAGIILVDDTIINGNMFGGKAQELAERGIDNVHGRSAADKHGNDCPWGIVMEANKMIYNRTGNRLDLMAKELGLRSVRFLPYMDEAKVMLGNSFDDRMQEANENVRKQYEKSGANIDEETMKTLAFASLGLCFGCRADNGLFLPYAVNPPIEKEPQSTEGKRKWPLLFSMNTFNIFKTGK